MDRISGAHYVTVGGKRRFVNKDLGTNTPGTVLDATLLNGLQEEIVTLVEALGLVASDADWTQLRKAVARMAAGNISTVTATATLTADHAGLVLVDATAANLTITLPAVAAANGKPLRFQFVRLDATSRTVSIAVGSGDSLRLDSAPLALAGGGTVVIWGDGGTQWVKTSPAPSGVSTYSTAGSSTFTVPVGVTSISVRAWGGGGGSMASSGGGVYTNGGGAGGYAEGVYAVSPGQTIAVTVGAGGTASASGTAGGAGGATTVGSLITANGGAGATTAAGNLTSGGTATGGTINIPGGDSGGATPGQRAGAGGDAASGGQGGKSNQSTAVAGSAPGGGAGGAGPGFSGAVGAPGLVVIRW